MSGVKGRRNPPASAEPKVANRGATTPKAVRSGSTKPTNTEIVTLARTVQRMMSEMPMLSRDEMQAVVAGLDVPAVIKPLDLSSVLGVETVTFLVAGPADLPGSPAAELDRRLASFWARNPQPTLLAYLAACVDAWTAVGIEDVAAKVEMLRNLALEQGLDDQSVVTSGRAN